MVNHVCDVVSTHRRHQHPAEESCPGLEGGSGDSLVQPVALPPGVIAACTLLETLTSASTTAVQLQYEDSKQAEALALISSVLDSR